MLNGSFGFQRACGSFPKDTLGCPTEALVTSWNTEVATTLDRTVPEQPLPFIDPELIQATLGSETMEEASWASLLENKEQVWLNTEEGLS